MFSLDLSEGILQLLEVSYDIYNMLLKHAVGLICVDPSFWEGGSPWQIIEKINPYFVSVGCSLVVLFFVIGFCNSSTDTRNDVRFETILKSLIRVGVAEYFVVNSLTILKAIFGSVAALANLVSGGGLSRGLTVKLSDKMTKGINFLCCCNSDGEPRPNIQLVIDSSKYLYEFMKENPCNFKISAKCCDYCKKQAAHKVQKDYEMIITGERRDEGGMRSVPKSEDANGTMCFSETSSGQFRLKPLYYVSDKDKAWYKDRYGIKYSDAYEVYGLERTGCCGCSISARAVEDLEKIRPYEPNVVKAAWNIFGDSYRYRQQYNEFKRKKQLEAKNGGQMDIFDFPEVLP